MVDGLNDIIKDSKIKFPDRKYLFMYQSPEMQNFREMGQMDEIAKKQQDHRILREEVLETARETGGNVPDISHVSAAVSQQANMTEALRQQMEGLAASTKREQEGQRVETAREMERLAVAQRAEANRARIAEEVATAHRDAMAADRDRFAEASQAAGVTNNTVTHLYDQRTTNNSTVTETNVHAMMMNFMSHHQQQLAAFAQQQGLSNERAMEILYATLEKQQAQPQQVVQILQQTLINPNLPSNGPRQPPPSYGPAASSSSSQRESVTFPFPYSAPAALKPRPVEVPMLQPAAQPTATPVLPETPGRPRSRSVPRGRDKAKAKAKMEDVEVVPVIDTAMPSARKRAASQEVERAPVTVRKEPAKQRQASEGERVPVIKAKARPRKPAAVDDPETPQPPQRSRSRVSRARPPSETELVPVSMNTSRGASRSRPPRAASETPVLMDAVRTAAKELGEDIDVIPMIKPAKKTKVPPTKPVKKESKIKIDKEALRQQIRRVRIESAPEVKRGRGRPPGSLNKKTLAARAQVA